MELLLYGSMIFLAGMVFGCAFTKTICDLRRELDERIQKADISHLQDDGFLNQFGVFSRVFEKLENTAPTEKVDVDKLTDELMKYDDLCYANRSTVKETISILTNTGRLR